MNLIEQWELNGCDFDEGVRLYTQFGRNEQLKKVYQKGYAVFDINQSLKDELMLLKNAAFIPQVTAVKTKVKIQKEVAPPPPEEVPLIKKIDKIIRSNEEPAVHLSGVVKNLVHDRNKLANELTNENLSIPEAQSKIKIVKHLGKERIEAARKLNYYLAEGELPKEKAVQKSDHELDIFNITDKGELTKLVKRARSRRAKANANAAKKPQKRNHYLKLVDREEKLIERIQKQIQYVS